MKKVVAIFSSLLLLTGCSFTEPIPIRGQVVSCESIPVSESSSPRLECLGGGEGIAVDAIRGPAIVNVWGTWCAPCRKELPHFAEFLTQYSDRVSVLGIAVEEKNQENVRKFIRTRGITWPIIYDADGSTKKKFGMGVPVTWLINKSGKVVYKKYGPFESTEELERAAIKYLGV